MVESLEQIHARAGWIGVDLDGTLFEYHGLTRWNEFGRPIPLMVERVRNWLAEGRDVRIVTARIGIPMGGVLAINLCGRVNLYSRIKRNVCLCKDEMFSDRDMYDAIWRHCEIHIGQGLPAQCYKDFAMIELWDDRVVQVQLNTGLRMDSLNDSGM
jgi:hypothetical protein